MDSPFGSSIPHYDISEVRRLVRLGHRRLTFAERAPTQEQLDSAAWVNDFLKKFSDPPDDKTFRRGLRLAQGLGREKKIRAEIAMDRRRCLQFIREAERELGSRPPSPDQLTTLDKFERVTGIKAPLQSRETEKAWETFLNDKISAKDIEDGREAALELSIKLEAGLGGQVHGIYLAGRLAADRHAIVVERAVDLLRGREEPFIIAEQLGLAEAEVERLQDNLELELESEALPEPL